MIHEFTDEFWRCSCSWRFPCCGFCCLWFWFGHGCGSRFAASAPPAVLILIRPLLRGKRREIINFNLTNLSFSVDTFEVQRRYFSLVQWSKTANMSKTSNNNLFFNSSLTPENIHVFIKHPYLHCVQTLSIHVIRRTGKTLKGILLTTFRDSYQKKIRWFTHFDGSIV